ncbi:hypothetical protein B0H14DRAFT_3151828 [Mycena olivaceomarginata]|nr:hypothetical protein B0H14DRAFT_3151828 [Mycena olivaceomarginata]
MSATIIVCDPEPFARSGLCQVANPPQYTGSAQLVPGESGNVRVEKPSPFLGLHGCFHAPKVPEANRPKNQRLNFRPGDWMVLGFPSSLPHEVIPRNKTCIACGCSRCPVTDDSASASCDDQLLAPTASMGVSPHPHLTPSGRALARGGKVQNVSSDPLSPCIMYWPDNEPFPEQGQIRPTLPCDLSNLPIRNTGNRGPILHQPGDWICLKCNYLNWRRRKVCQTCLPYAEGNGDRVSPTVKTERIVVLTSALGQSGFGSTGAAPPKGVRGGKVYSVGHRWAWHARWSGPKRGRQGFTAGNITFVTILEAGSVFHFLPLRDSFIHTYGPIRSTRGGIGHVQQMDLQHPSIAPVDF